MASKESKGKKRFPRLLSFRNRGKRIPLFSDKYGSSKCNMNRSEISEINEGSNDIFLDASVTKNATVSVSQQIVNAVHVSSSAVTQHDLPSVFGSANLSLNNSSAFAKYKSLKRSVSDVGKGILGKLKHRNRDHESASADNASESKVPNDSTKLVTSKHHKCSYRKEKNRSKTPNSMEQNNASMISLGYNKPGKYKHDSYKSFTKKEKTKKSASIINILSSTPNKVVQPDERISHHIVQDCTSLPGTEKPVLKSNNPSCSNFESESLQDLTESICQMSEALCTRSVESIACICDCKNKNSTTVCCDKRKTLSPDNVVPEVIPDKVLGHQSPCDNNKLPASSCSANTLKAKHIADNKDTCSVLSFQETNIGHISCFKDHLVGVNNSDDNCSVDVNDDCCDEPTDNCHLWDDSDCSVGECSDLDCSCCDQSRSHSDTDDISVSSSDSCSDSVSTTSESIQQCCDTLLMSMPGKFPSKSCLFTSRFPQESVDTVEGNDSFDINMSPNSVSFRELDCDNGDVMYIDSSCTEQLKGVWSDSPQTLVHNRRYTSLCATQASSPVLKFSRHSTTKNNKDASWIGNHVDHLQNLDSSPEIYLKDLITKTNICRENPWVKAEIGPSNICQTVLCSANHSCQSIKGSPDLSVQSVDSSPTPLDLSQNNRTDASSDEICTDSADNRSPTQNHVLPEVSCSNRSQYTAASPECNSTQTSTVSSAKIGSQYSSFYCHNNRFSCHTSSVYCATSHSNFVGNKPKTYATSLNRSNSSFQCPKRTFSRGDSHYASFHGWSPMSPLDLSLNKTNTSLTSHKGRTGKWIEHVGQLYSPAKRVLHKNRGLSETDLCKQILDLYVSDAEESVFEASDGVISSCFTSFSGHKKIVDLGSHVDDSILQYGTYVGPRNVGKETNVDDFTTTVVRSCYSGKAKTRRLQGGPSNDFVQGADKHSSASQETLLKLQSQSRPDQWEVNVSIIHDQSKDVLPGATKTDKQGVSCQALRDKTNTSHSLSSLELSGESVPPIQPSGTEDEPEDKRDSVCDKSFDRLTMLHTAHNGKRKVRCLTLDESQNAITDYPPPKEATSISWGQTLSEMDLYRHSPRKTPIKIRPILAQKENNYPYEDSTPSPIVLTKMRKPKSFSKKYKNWPWT